MTTCSTTSRPRRATCTCSATPAPPPTCCTRTGTRTPRSSPSGSPPPWRSTPPPPQRPPPRAAAAAPHREPRTAAALQVGPSGVPPEPARAPERAACTLAPPSWLAAAGRVALFGGGTAGQRELLSAASHPPVRELSKLFGTEQQLSTQEDTLTTPCRQPRKSTLARVGTLGARRTASVVACADVRSKGGAFLCLCWQLACVCVRPCNGN